MQAKEIRTRKAGMVLHYMLLGNPVQMMGKKWKISTRGFLVSYDSNSECYVEENIWFHKFMHFCDDIGTQQWLQVKKAVKESESENLHVFRQKKAV